MSNAGIQAANEANFRKANDRVETLAQMRNDTAQRVASGELSAAAAQPQLDLVDKSMSVLREETQIRAALNYALTDPNGVDPKEVKRRLDELDALRKRYRTRFYANGARVADPCMPCIAKAIAAAKKAPPKTDTPPVKKKPSRGIVKADQEMLRVVNEQLGTSVNFGALAQFEGGQWTRGYVPPAGRSGVTIGTGFDIGQWTRRDLRAKLGLPEELASRFDPYTGLIRGNAAAALRQNPLEITRDDANVVDQSVHRYFVEETMKYWDHRIPENGVAYRDLTSAQQTVLMSRTYHQGIGMPNTSVARDFYHSAQRNDWSAAESALRHYKVSQGWYRERTTSEANLLRAERLGRG